MTQSPTFVPDATTDEIVISTFMTVMFLALPFLFISGLSSKGPVDPDRVSWAFALVTPALIPVVWWVVRNLKSRDDGFEIGETSLERMERGAVVWRRDWSDLVLKDARRMSMLSYVRGTVLEVLDKDGSRLGRIELNMSHETARGQQHRKLMAFMVEHASEFDLARPPIDVRRRGYLVKGTAWASIGGTVMTACILGIGRLLDGVNQGVWDEPLVLWSVLGLLPAVGMTILGVIELSHWFRDKDLTDERVQHLARFVERPVLERVEMEPGVWYRYRNAHDLGKSWVDQAKFMTVFVVGLFLMMPLSLALRSRFDPEGAVLHDWPAFVAMIPFSIGIFWWMALYLRGVARHRFRLEGGVLEVSTAKRTRIFPAPARKRWKGRVRKRSWLSVTDSYGRWPHKYNLDPCWIEVED